MFAIELVQNLIFCRTHEGGSYTGLFDKKYCDICGEKIKLLGNRKLDDGNLCKECAKGLSPWFEERRHSTVEQIKEQLEYREENKQKVENFQVSRTFGRNYMVLLDEDKRQFLVTSGKKYREVNPDVLDFSQVTGCDLDIQEMKSEETYTDSEGNRKSYNPPRYDYDYDFYMIIRVNHPWFDDMKFKLNNNSVSSNMPLGGMSVSADYNEYVVMGREIKEILMQARQDIRDEIAEANKPKAAVTCPWCGATTVPDVKGCCEYCAGAING